MSKAKQTTRNTTIDLYDKDKATEAFDDLDDDEEFLSEDEYILDLRRFIKDATDEDKNRVTNIPLGKWGYQPHHSEKYLLSPNVLALARTRGTTTDSETDFQTHIFVATTDTIQPVETIEALRHIRADATESERQWTRLAQTVS